MFLISQSPGARARLINKASGLDSQEELIAYCNTQIRACTDDIKIKEHLRTSLISTVSKLSPVKNLESSIEKLGNSLKRVEKIEREYEDIADRVVRLSELETILEEEKSVENIRSQSTEATRLIGKAAEIEGQIAGIGYD